MSASFETRGQAGKKWSLTLFLAVLADTVGALSGGMAFVVAEAARHGRGIRAVLGHMALLGALVASASKDARLGALGLVVAGEKG